MAEWMAASGRVVTTANAEYTPYLACFLLSLGEHAATTLELHVTIIHDGIPEPIRRQLQSLMSARHRVSWFQPTAQSLLEINAPSDFLDLSIHYWRLLSPFVLRDVSSCVYIDADTIVLRDPSPLWAVDLNGHIVAAVRDCLPCVSDAVANWAELGLPPSASYLNSGVLVMDLERWRSERVSERVVDVCRKNAKHLFAQGKWPQHDQYGINVILRTRWMPLDAAWNHWSFVPDAQARIVHYLGDGKPNLPGCQPVFRRLFFDTLARTSLGPQLAATHLA